MKNIHGNSSEKNITSKYYKYKTLVKRIFPIWKNSSSFEFLSPSWILYPTTRYIYIYTWISRISVFILSCNWISFFSLRFSKHRLHLFQPLHSTSPYSLNLGPSIQSPPLSPLIPHLEAPVCDSLPLTNLHIAAQ